MAQVSPCMFQWIPQTFQYCTYVYKSVLKEGVSITWVNSNAVISVCNCICCMVVPSNVWDMYTAHHCLLHRTRSWSAAVQLYKGCLYNYSRNWHIMWQSLCKGHWHVLSTQGRDENAVFAVRLLIHGKGRELGDLVYVTTLQVGGARRLMCCSSGQGTLGCRLHTCNCIHTLQILVSVNMQYLYI